MNILVAEDQETTRFILASRLREWGHTVVAFENGKAALVHLLRNPDTVDMIITDWNMPEMSGVELARNVRKLTKSSGYIYIILLTVKGENADLITGFNDGQVDDYLVKPFSAVKLRLHVQVGGRLMQSERALRAHSEALERQVREQTEAVRETQEEIVSRLFSALESRDQETALHVRRIGVMSACMARLLGWDDARVDMLQSAAPLHDIGKIGVCDALLRKAGWLTPDEYEQMQQHTVIGARILSGSQNPTIQMAERIALFHHENWDGSGYPQGLRGDRIPLEAQLVSVVDVYDAQLADRVYRKGAPEEEVLDYICGQAGCKFAPGLVDLFMDHLEEIKERSWKSLVQ